MGKISSFRNHVVTTHKSVFRTFSYMDGQPKIVAGDDASSLEGKGRPLYHIGK